MMNRTARTLGRRTADTVADARGQAGFTLIEMLIATAIISILAGVAVFAVGKAKDNAHKNACLTERRAFETALNTAEIEDQRHSGLDQQQRRKVLSGYGIAIIQRGVNQPP
ncbi:MAG: prepilin-type N-terminal cleavage/methylation domain-containing protein [Microthrixaceae bacterium]